MPLKQFPPPPDKKPSWMSYPAWLDHLEEVKAGEKRIVRWSKWRPQVPRSQDVPAKDD
jgi:hypothetical protein